jgi:hypothetical protein
MYMKHGVLVCLGAGGPLRASSWLQMQVKKRESSENVLFFVAAPFKGLG